MSKRFALILAGLVIVFFGLLFFNQSNSDTATDSNNAETIQGSNHVQGDPSAAVTLTEWGDFQCPACAQYYLLVNQIKEEYGDRIAFRFRHFPLQAIHQNALISSRAAEAAGMQDKFFEMHDLLFENQQSWAQSSNPSETFEGYAEQLGLDVEKFREDMRSDRVNRIVQADLAAANDKGFSSTPTFEINGERIDNPRGYDDFKELIDNALAESKSTEASSNQ